MLINTLDIIIPIEKPKQIPPYNNNFIYFLELPHLDLTNLTQYLTKARNNGIKFTNLILSGTNEISHLNDNIFINVINTIKPFYDLFLFKYIRTNGNLLIKSNNNKFMVVSKDFIIRIPQYSLNEIENNNFFQYDSDYISYTSQNNFSNSKICLELICLKDTSYESISTLITTLLEKYNNEISEFHLQTLKLYGTNINAMNIRDMEFSNWILNFAFKQYASSTLPIQTLDMDIKNYINTLTSNCGLEFSEYYDWQFQKKRITMNRESNLQLRYTKNHIFYGDKQIDYNGNIMI